MASKNAVAIMAWLAVNAAPGSAGVTPEDIVGKVEGAEKIGAIAVYNILMRGIKAGQIVRTKVDAKFRYSLAEQNQAVVSQ